DRLRELFIKHANARRVRAIVAFREIAATQQLNAHGAEIMARHEVVVGTVAELRLVGSSWNTYRTAQTTAGHRRGCGDTRCFHPGQCFEYHNNRSEEHTSELQSRFDLVCRLLLEKKKKKKKTKDKNY